MATASSIAKVSIGRSGCGAAHASYITRMSALDPPGRERERELAELGEQLSLFAHDQSENNEPGVAETLKENLDGRSLGKGKEHGGGGQRDSDPVWTWNAPDFLTGNVSGTNLKERSIIPEKLTLREKTENVRLYFGSLEEYEKRKGGRTHYRIILSFDVPATNRQIRDLTNTFLEQAFPKAIALGAIHRDTDHPHVHLYLNSRQTDGRRIQLKNNEFKTIDEKWARIYTEFAGDKSAYIDYLRKKEETKQWKIAAAEAYRKGEPIPPKPERDNDRRERLAEQRLAAQRSDARDRGKQLESPKQAELVVRPASEKETSRLLARAEVAREQLGHLIRTDAPDIQIKSAAKIAHEFASALDKTLAMRKEIGREKAPQVVYTTEEWKQLKEYAASRQLPVKNDHAAARLQAICVLAGAVMKDAHERAEAFQASRHFWKFEVEGWDRKLSLKEVEQAIKSKAEEKRNLYNFLRPSKREHIQGEIDYLRDVKKDVQKQLAARELSIARSVGAAETRYHIASGQVEQTAKGRANDGQSMPRPVHEKEEITRINEIAVSNKDGQLLRYVYEHVKDKLLANPSPEVLSRLKGHEVMAEMEMMRRGERLANAIQFGEFRQLPLKDFQGLHYTKSVREVSPRSALETVIRHFTDSAEQKRERKALTDTLRQQLDRAQEQCAKASDYYSALNKMLGDHCRAAGALPRQVAPMLNSEQIAELREYAEKQPYLSTARREFTDAAREADRLLHEREAAEAARQAEQARANDLSSRTREQSESRSSQHSDRDSYSRGR